MGLNEILLQNLGNQAHVGGHRANHGQHSKRKQKAATQFLGCKQGARPGRLVCKGCWNSKKELPTRFFFAIKSSHIAIWANKAGGIQNPTIDKIFKPGLIPYLQLSTTP